MGNSLDGEEEDHMKAFPASTLVDDARRRAGGMKKADVLQHRDGVQARRLTS